jgi:hypothetical protein
MSGGSLVYTSPVDPNHPYNYATSCVAATSTNSFAPTLAPTELPILALSETPCDSPVNNATGIPDNHFRVPYHYPQTCGRPPRPRHRHTHNEGDIVFVAHHKTGTKAGENLARALCWALGREVHYYTYREPIAQCSGRPSRGWSSRCCHFVRFLEWEDAATWVRFVKEHRDSRLVHFARRPSELVASAYEYHLRGAEKWTTMEACSRDLCYASPRDTRSRSKKEARPIFEEGQHVGAWLRALGCSGATAESSSYCDCLRNESTGDGLAIEARRSRDRVRAMLDLDELARRAVAAFQMRTVCTGELWALVEVSSANDKDLRGVFPDYLCMYCALLPSLMAQKCVLLS